jgi:excisionase family DNA binding protein
MPLQMHGINSRPLGLSTSQAARELGVSLGTVRRWSDMGYLQSYRTPGGQRRFSVEHIEQFVRSLQQNGAISREQSETPAQHRAVG